MPAARFRRVVTWSAVATAGVAASTVLVNRACQPVHATTDERTRPLPGDDLIAGPLGTFTNAVTVHAAPREVWPWVAQMGAGRAGWYSYDALDNGRAPSATHIKPELQRLEVGMVF